MRNLQKLTPLFFLFLKLFVLTFCLSFRPDFLYGQKTTVKKIEKTGIPNSEESFLLLPFRLYWVFEDKTNPPHTIASDNESNVFPTFLGGKIYSIKYISGEINWKSDLGGEFVSKPVIADEYLYVATNTNLSSQTDIDAVNPTTSIRALSKMTGLTVWQIKLSFAEEIYLYNYKSILVAVSKHGEIYSLDKISGEVIFSKTTGSELSSQPYFKADKVIFGIRNRRILTLSIETGEKINETYVDTIPTSIVSFEKDETITWGNHRGMIRSQKTGAKFSKNKWKFRNGAEISHITATTDNLLVSSLDNFIYLISKQDGKLLWKKRFLSRIVSEPLIIGNYAVITSNAEREVFIIELTNGKTVNRITLDEGNFFIERAINIQDKLIFTTLRGIFVYTSN